MKQAQSIKYTLPTTTYAASSQSTQTLRDLPKQYFGRLCHLSKLHFGITFTPTFAANTVPIASAHNIFSSVDFWDGSFMRFQGSLNYLRDKERLQTGRLRVPDRLENATTVASYWGRTMHAGPPQFRGSPSDWVIPTGSLENGELRFSHNAVATIDADATAATATIRIVASLVLLDEIRIPPAYQFVNQSATGGDVNLAGRALYETVALLDSSANGDFAAAEVGAVRLDLGNGDVVANVQSVDLSRDFQDDFASGSVGTFMGDAVSVANDNANRQVNLAAATALAIGAFDCQPILWSPPETQISKLHIAESVCRLRWDGTQTTGVVLVGRILPQPGTVVGSQIAKSIGRLNMRQKDLKIATLSKKIYAGPYGEFMPWKVKVG